jgi:uncharacterized membrane protein YdjX (TVP38/TMEM64 family)
MSTQLSESGPDSIPEAHARDRRRRAIVSLFLLAGIGVVAYLGGAWWAPLSSWIENSGSLGYLVFFFVFVGMTTFCFPVSILGFSAGAMFGPGLGLLLLVGSGFTSGSVMFAVGRFLFRDRILEWVSRRPKLAALDNLAEQRALRLNLLARLSPLNYGVVCYTLASGKSPFPSYLLGMVAIVPGMAGQVWAGSLAAKARQAAAGQGDQSTLEWILLASGMVFFFLLSWQIGRLVREAWNSVPEIESNADDLGK